MRTPLSLAAQFFFDFLDIAIYESDALTRDLKQGMLDISRAPASADALWGLLKERGDLNEAELFELADGDDKVRTQLAELLSAGRVREVALAGERRYICSDEADIYAQFPHTEHARAFVLGRFAETRPAFGPGEWMRRYGLSREDADRLLEAWAKDGRIVPMPDMAEERAGRAADGTDARTGRRTDAAGPRAGQPADAADPKTGRPAGAAGPRTGRPPGLADPQAGLPSGTEDAPAGLGAGTDSAPPAARKWMSARLFERVERNLANRRRANRAAPETLLRLLLERHHLAPERRLSGPEGVSRALDLLQGLFLPVSWWESIILPARVADYRREDLDLLCASGEWFWLGRRGEGEREGRIAFFRADRPDLYRPFLPAEETEPLHPDLHARLRERGARFLTALAGDTGEAPSQLTARLMDMVWQGLVANDQFAPLRLPGRKTDAAGRGKYRPALGRWYTVRDLAEGESKARDDGAERSVLAWTRHLMRVFGVLTRAVVNAYSPFGWEAHQLALARMEELGLAVRGLFVQDIPALQFADRETVERLRDMRPREADEPDAAAGGDIVLLSAADPANPFGLLLDWPAEQAGDARFARRPDNHLLLDRGRWLLWTENKSRNITAIDPAARDPSRQASCIRTAARHLIRQHGQRKVVIERIDGTPAAESPLREALARTGAERDGSALVIWPSRL